MKRSRKGPTIPSYATGWTTTSVGTSVFCSIIKHEQRLSLYAGRSLGLSKQTHFTRSRWLEAHTPTCH